MRNKPFSTTLLYCLTAAALSFGMVACSADQTAVTQTAPGPAQAQGAPSGPGAGGRGARMLQRLTQALDLTPQQLDEIKPVLAASRAQSQQVRNDSTLTDDQKMQKMQQIRKSENQQIEKYLTPDQITKWKAVLAKARARWGGGGGQWGGRPAGAPQAGGQG